MNLTCVWRNRMESENNQQHKKDQESSLQEQESGVQDCSADVVQDINQISSEIEFIQTECDSESLETTVLLTDTSGKEAVQNNQNLLTERNSKESPQLKDVIEVEDTAFDTEEPGSLSSNHLNFTLYKSTI